MEELVIKIDGIAVGPFTAMNPSHEWIVDANRNDNDYMLISNPVKKLKLALSSSRMSKSQFAELAAVIGKVDITHSVQMYDDVAQVTKIYDMYNSTLSYSKRAVGGAVVYENVSFSLIER